MFTRRIHRWHSVFILFAILSMSCATQQQGTPGASVYYRLPLLPIQITYDFINKHLQVSVSGEIQTPLGTFGLTTGVSFVEKRFPGIRILTIETGQRKFVYQLEQGRPYSINIPSDENGKTQIIYSGTDENLSIVIPNPTNETVAGLKAKLKEECQTAKLELPFDRDIRAATRAS